MEKEKSSQDIEKTKGQIKNLEEINEKTDITINIPEKETLDQLYNDFKTFGKTERNAFLTKLSKLEGINSDNKKYNTMKNEQRLFLLEKLKERVSDHETKQNNQTPNNSEDYAKEA
jgi:hypothetical protein